ncbi:cell division protein DivIVA [Nocardiopsis sp. HNM0947]|uniref:Cell division protein DivIVA n=1 Tax=Nocardiopsis coralli TaxID=2772213 RepID=A0ABR9P4R8_9ACTN|nr:ATP synthase F0 subunit B [Nocardiopsis coralli]MBE2998843.1 cell division protein DivIVA [Nocardiopsis coralli]
MLPGGGLQQDRFPTVRKGGYDKAHVDDYYVRMDNQFKDLRERLQRMDEELEQYKRDLAIAREKAQVKPEHEQISERMAEILRIAEEEAKERRSRVESEVEEAEKKAKDEVSKYRKEAEEHAERIVSSAREEATEMVAGAKKEAEQLREQAKQEGDRRLSEAEARAKKIHDTADRRLATLTATHAEALRRLKDMHSTLADLVEAEDKAGALETGLSREDTVTEPEAPAKPGSEKEQGKKGAEVGGKSEPKQGQGKPAESAKPAKPAEKADAAQAAEKPAPSGKDAGGEQGDEPTAKLSPAPQEADEATVRIKPAQKPEEGKGDQDEAKGPQAAAAPPQGARFNAPAPEGAEAPAQPGQDEGTDSGDPGITGIYRRPEGGPQQAGPAAPQAGAPAPGPQAGGAQPPTGDEGVRVIRKE